MKLLDATIYDGIEALGLSVDVQGWHSEHPIFERLVVETRPTTIIEVGSWKGASALRLAALTAHQPVPAKIYCVDTWLGSREIWNNPGLAAENPKRHGYPQVYFQFLHNVKAAGFAARIVPVPATSRIGAGMLFDGGVSRAELVYVDASHDFVDVLHDLKTYWPFVAPGGVMFGDDYSGFPGVRMAVETFCSSAGFDHEVVAGNFWVIRNEKFQPGAANNMDSKTQDNRPTKSGPAELAVNPGAPADSREFLAALLEDVQDQIDGLKPKLVPCECKDAYEHGWNNGAFCVWVELRRSLKEQLYLPNCISAKDTS